MPLLPPGQLEPPDAACVLRLQGAVVSREDGKYSRLYWSVKDDAKFDGIRSDPAAFGTWTLLLMDADAAWPSSPSLPRWVRRRELGVLVTATIVDLLPDDRYRIHGLDDERTRRAEAARVGGIASGRTRSVVRRSNERSTETNLDKTSIDKTSTSIARDGLPNLDRAALDALEECTGELASQAGEKQLGEYDRLVGRHGLTATLQAFGTVRGNKRMTARQLVWGAVKVLEPFVDGKAAVKDEQADADRRAHQARLDRTQRELADLRGKGDAA